MPVRNESTTIADVVGSLLQQGIQQVRVVDNGSTDDSAERAKAAGAEVVAEPLPGYGQACWRGLQDIEPHIEWIVFCDGDGSDDLGQLGDFFEASQTSDFILGDRSATTSGRRNLTAAQRFGNWLATTLMYLGWGYRYRDLGPLRLIRRSVLERIGMSDRGFGWTLEMQVRAIEEQVSICELPVAYRPRQGGQSKISGSLVGSYRAGKAILGSLMILYWRRLQRMRSSVPPLKLEAPVGPVGKPTTPSTFAAWEPWLSGLLVILGAIAMAPNGDFVSQGVQPLFWLGAGLMGTGFVLTWREATLPLWQFWGVAIAARCILLAMHPGDDMWRYLWEGWLQLNGVSPYDFAPNAPELEVLRTAWWSSINHPDVSAIYPPVTQLGFRLLAWIQPSVLLFKLGFVAADLAVCGVLARWVGPSRATVYAWNPLVLYSFAGGGHYDSWFVLPLVMAWGIADLGQGSRRWLGASLCLGFSIAVKWVSLPLLGFVSWRAWRDRHVGFAVLTFGVGLLPMAIAALMFCADGTCPLIPVSSTFVSHGRSAELFPYIAGWLWPISRESNWIYGLPLAISTLVLIAASRHFLAFTERFFLVLLVLTPIVHAWYFTWLVPFAAVTRHWGIRLVSLSAFVYFVLPHRQFMGNADWLLSNSERMLLWLPFILGIVYTAGQRLYERRTTPSTAQPLSKT
ncbi:MAG: glycosyltransferase family 2 protein [Cyanobacteria bacterium P01_E01_bin.34]